MTLAPTATSLLTSVSGALPQGAASWLALTLSDDTILSSRQRLRLAFTQLARKLGAAADSALADERGPCTLLDLARLALVLAALERTPSRDHTDLVEELYRTGAQREQQSVLRTLSRLPDPARFTALGLEACRTNSVPVFAAIAHDNTFPAQHFPELGFNQMVLKAIFLGVPVARIHALDARVNSELRRMLEDYASERRAAGRAVPDDVGALLALCSSCARPTARLDER